MDHVRKKHWVRYSSDKCKMYLRNDFRFQCAYCGLHEANCGVMGELCFEKDHFIPRNAQVNWDIEQYENMVYACRTCNSRKSDEEVYLLLDPCRDDIYSGDNPHIKKLGAEDHYKVIPMTAQAKQFIEIMQLNSRFYRRMREYQEEHRENQQKIETLLCQDIKDGCSDEFRCGQSEAGQDILQLLSELRGKEIPYQLLFNDDDLDIRIDFQGSTYDCEIKIHHSERGVNRKPYICDEKKREWVKTGNKCGILCYYAEKELLKLYVVHRDMSLAEYNV